MLNTSELNEQMPMDKNIRGNMAYRSDIHGISCFLWFLDFNIFMYIFSHVYKCKQLFSKNNTGVCSASSGNVDRERPANSIET